ncbi:MAG TPA: DinB family protein [Chitinophagaceae bacterium]|nr:DinB family protein [Chitinophagaceae bacterium]
MNRSILYARTIREKFLLTISSLSIEQLNMIPAGMNNNIAWQLGHLVVSTEILCYVRSGVQADRIIAGADQYRNGTKPEAVISAEEIDSLKERLLNSMDSIEQEYNMGGFKNVQPYATHTFGLQLHTIEEVLECCALHDTLHWGHVSAMKKLV